MNTSAAQYLANRWDCRNFRFAWPLTVTCLALDLLLLSSVTLAQTQGTPLPPSELKKLSVEELMNLEVTTVSKRPEKLSETASAIQIITQEDIRRSGATSLPEALRLAPNLQVAQVNAHDWAITARGFNGSNNLADKLLVMIDGRSVYTPLFGGVFWDVQNVLLEDIDRIEVVSGPGGTLWGANAVNGVINIVTKSAKDTQGWYASGAGGSFGRDFGAVRYGWNVGSKLFFRLYAQRFDHESTRLASGADAQDSWDMTQGGFRMEYYPSTADTLTVQGDVYAGSEGVPTTTLVNGQNVLGRWRHTFSEKSDLSLQVYFDRTWRNSSASFKEDLRTYDFDFQHRFPLGERHSILWGAGYRLSHDDLSRSVPPSFFPALRNLQLFNGFVQDEITVVPNRLKLTLGTKLEHNVYSGLEVQPSLRIAWMPTGRQTIWGAVSRAVRSPSRFDADFFTPAFIGGKNFDSEKVAAYELGYRIRPAERVSLSLAAFYNHYDDVRSINQNTSPPPPFTFANDQSAESWGGELSGNYQATNWWRLRGGYTYLGKSLRATNSRVFPGSDALEANDPHHQFLVQSIMDLPGHVQLDLVGRLVDSLQATALTPRIPNYLTFDVRLGWQFKRIEIALVGQNLGEKEHPEFGPGLGREIPRSIFGRVAWRWNR